MRMKFLLVGVLLLSSIVAHAQSSLEAICSNLGGRDLVLSENFTSEELEAQLMVSLALSNLPDKPAAAINIINEAISIADDYGDAYLGRGCAYFLQGDMERAEADFARFIQFTHDTALAETISGLISGTAQTNTNVCAMNIRSPGTFESPAEAQEFIDNFNTNTKTPDYDWRAEAYLCLGEYDLALDDLAAAIALAPNSPEYYSLRGIVYRRLGEYELAIADYNTALELDPDYLSALNGRAYSSYLSGDYEQCIEDYDRSIALDDQDHIAFGNRGLCYDALGDYETAITDYNAALEIDPDNAIIIGNRAVSYRMLEEYDLALADNNLAIEIDPNDPFYYVERGLVYYELGQYVNAEADFLAAIELNPNYASAWLNLGDTQRQLKDNPGAVESYQRYLELYPDSAYAEELRDFIAAHS